MEKKTKRTTVTLTRDTYDRLAKLAHKGQSFDGLIAELMDVGKFNISPETIARLEDFKTSPVETLDDLINNLIDEVKEKKAC